MPKRKLVRRNDEDIYSTKFRQFTQELHENTKSCKRSTPSMMQTPDLGSPKEVWSLLCSKDELIQRHWGKKNHPEIDSTMRLIVTDWLMEVSADRKLHRETYHLAVEYFDRFMYQSSNLTASELQLVATAALSIACKMEEIYPPKMQDLVEYSDGGCTMKQVASMETIMLIKLGWNFTPITTIHWLSCYLQLLAKKTEHSPQFVRKRGSSLPSLPESEDESSFLDYNDGVTLNTSVNDSFLLEPSQSADEHVQINETAILDEHVIINESICVPKLMRDEFIQFARVCDFLINDPQFLKYRYAELAAAVLFCSYEPSEAIEEITGFKRDNLSELITVVQFYVDYCHEMSWIRYTSFLEDISNDDQHNIQIHIQGIQDMLQDIKSRQIKKMLELKEIHNKIKTQKREAILKDVN